ncbi:putative serine carboxypeptidase CPVL [Pseudolycoriella hygida]|uniref:Carboxypeptidase n=1 Tax=Pseudolycoriella hygida TaxID=35572 RepID=A0A9Q0S874_9DIPT|nr:putative serine carboxypeptidase CPVL [Pseudolycoriella hygida]
MYSMSKSILIHAILQFLCHCDSSDNQPLFLTPLINYGKINEARDASQVRGLILSDYNNTILSYSGFLTVNREYNSNMFFWFVPSQNNPQDNPLLLWLQGGPGESSLYGLFTEHGPFKIDYASKKLNYRKESWTTTHSVLYMDSPVGAGFSFTEDDRGYATSQNDVAKNVYEGLLQFFKLFPEYKARDFYVAGESYGGKYVPSVAHKIHRENKKIGPMSDSFVNLKGLIMGNAFTDPLTTINYGSILYDLGLIDYYQLQQFLVQENRAKRFIVREKYVEAFDVMDKLILGSKNTSTPTYFSQTTGFNTIYNILRLSDPEDMLHFKQVLQKPEDDAIIRPFIHVGNRTFQHFDLGGPVAEHLEQDIYQSVKHLVEDLLNAKNENNGNKYKIVFYTGQLDVVCGVAVINKLIASLQGWKELEQFQNKQKSIWYFDNDEKIIAGYFKSYGSLTHVIVRNAGHRVSI